MDVKQAKRGRIIRYAAVTAMISLVALAAILNIQVGAQYASKSRQAETLHQIGAEIAQSARRLDEVGPAAVRALAQTDLFDLSVLQIRRAAKLDQNKVHLALIGAADFRLRNAKAHLRRSRLQADFNPTMADAKRREAAILLREAADNLRLDVENAAKKKPGSAVLAPAQSALSGKLGVSADNALFWVIWNSADRQSSLAALFITVGGEGAAFKPLANLANAQMGPVTMAVPLAGGGLLVTNIDLSRQLSDIDARAVIPALLIAVLIGGAFIVYTMGDKARTDQLDRRHQQILRNIAAKQRELEDSEARFSHLAVSTNVIPWAADLDNQRFTYIGPQIEGLTGYTPDAWLAHGFWAQHIHPGDRNRVIKTAMERASGGAYATIDYRIRADNGKILHVRNMLTIEEELVEEPDGSPGKICKTARGFMLDVTELRQAAAALEVARRKAEEANRVKSEFLANMSHELRTPLNAVIGFSEIMKDAIFGPLDERYREYAESVHASGKHLLELINDVLDLSKIEAGRIELTEEVCDIGGILKESRTLLLERISAAGLHEVLEIDPKLPKLLIDERRIKQVLLNLMSNAIKFTPPGGTLRLSTQYFRGKGVHVAVRDSGIGMGPEEIPRALAKFGQIDGELARKHDGTGLGLPIAKSLIEMHGGEFDIWSEKGKGTEMRIWLPEFRIVRDTSAAGCTV